MIKKLFIWVYFTIAVIVFGYSFNIENTTKHDNTYKGNLATGNSLILCSVYGVAWPLYLSYQVFNKIDPQPEQKSGSK